MDFILRWLLTQLQSTFGSIYQLISAISGDVYNQSVVQAILVLFKSIGLSIVGLAMISFLLKSLINHADGKEFSVIDILKRFIGGVVIYTYGVDIMSQFYSVFLSVTGKVVSALSGIAADSIEFTWQGAIFADMSRLMIVILIIISIFYLIKTFLSLLERAWQYLVLLCMMYLYLGGYIMGNDEAIAAWFKQCIAVLLSQFFQVALVTLGMCLFAANGGVSEFCFAIGAIIASSKVEQLLDKYGMGSGGKVGNAARNAISMGFHASSILRSVK